MVRLLHKSVFFSKQSVFVKRTNRQNVTLPTINIDGSLFHMVHVFYTQTLVDSTLRPLLKMRGSSCGLLASS